MRIEEWSQCIKDGCEACLHTEEVFRCGAVNTQFHKLVEPREHEVQSRRTDAHDMRLFTIEGVARV